jgi:hypothetical protein
MLPLLNRHDLPGSRSRLNAPTYAMVIPAAGMVTDVSLRLLNLTVSRLTLLGRTLSSKDIELLVLRHEVAVRRVNPSWLDLVVISPSRPRFQRSTSWSVAPARDSSRKRRRTRLILVIVLLTALLAAATAIWLILALTIHSDLAGVRGGTEKGAPDLGE